jgi:hypothetical protein
MSNAIVHWIAGFTTGIATVMCAVQPLRRWEKRQVAQRADGKAYHRRERGFEYCDCGLFDEMNP